MICCFYTGWRPSILLGNLSCGLRVNDNRWCCFQVESLNVKAVVMIWVLRVLVQPPGGGFSGALSPLNPEQIHFSCIWVFLLSDLSAGLSSVISTFLTWGWLWSCCWGTGWQTRIQFSIVSLVSSRSSSVPLWDVGPVQEQFRWLLPIGAIPPCSCVLCPAPAHTAARCVVVNPECF